MSIQIRVDGISGLSASQKDTLDRGVYGDNYIFAHPRFKEEVLSRHFTETGGKNSEQIYETIQKGDQLNLADELGIIDLKIVMYNSWFSKVVGYTYLESLTIWINEKFFYGPKSVGSNLAHESMHQLGFTHNSTWSTSVPYQMNDIIEKLWKELNVRQIVIERFGD